MNPKLFCELLVFSFLVTARADLTNGLVAYYQLNGTTLDASGNDRSLTNNGALPDSDRFGHGGLAYAFDGTSSSMVEPNEADSLILRDAFTLSCWATFPNLSLTNYSLIRKDGDANLIIVGGKCYVETFLNGNEYRAFAGSPPVGEWCMIAATWDGTNFEQYLNGQKQVSAQDNFARIVPSAPITLGGSLIYSDKLHGSLNDARIYNRTLSASEIQQLYDLESGPRLIFTKAFTLEFSGLMEGSNYQLQASGDFTTWTNYGAPFTATAINYTNTAYQRFDNWNNLFFRLKLAP